MGLRSTMTGLLDESAPVDPDQLRKLLGRIDEALQRSRFALFRTRESSTVLQLIGLRRKMRTRRIVLLQRLKQMDFGVK